MSGGVGSDHRVFHPGDSKPRLREDLRFVPQMGSQPFYLIEDPVRSKFYRLGYAEYTFVSLLDGETTIDDALSRAASLSPMTSFSPQDGLSICKWLLDNELAVTESMTRRQAQPVVDQGFWQRWNPLMLRVPLVRPDRFFTSITPWVQWCFSVPVVLIWLGVLFGAATQLLTKWDAFTTTSQQIFAASNVLWLGLTWVLLKLVHEVAHGVVCKRYGGVVREAGVLLILFAPLAFVDVTCSWRFREKWQRIFTATAGMYVETFLAAVAVLLWSRQTDGPYAQIYLNTATMAGISTILFNANPLMRFDGYYVLSDWLAIPNLYTSGQQYLTYVGRRYFLGMSPTLPNWTPRVGLIIRCYGVTAFVWRILICAALIIAASAMFAGGGLVLAALAVVLWFGRPVGNLIGLLLGKGQGERPRMGRFATASAAVVLPLISIFLFVPWPGAASAPALVSYESLEVVRAGSDGFLNEVFVRDGQFVKQGQLLARLENEDLEVEFADLQLQIQASELKARQYQQQEKVGHFQVEQSRIRALRDRANELHEQVSELHIVASRNGCIVAPELKLLLATYLREGDEVLSIGDHKQKELKISVAQQDVDRFRRNLGDEVNVWLPGTESFVSRLDRVTPRATSEPPDEAFCASRGGPLPVELDEDASPPTFRFLRPRFTGYVSLTPSQSQTLRAGQMAIVSFSPLDQSIGSRLYQIAGDWIEEQRLATRQ